MTESDLPFEYKKLFRTLCDEDRALLTRACNTTYLIARKFDPRYSSSAVSVEEAYTQLKDLEGEIKNKKAGALVTRDIADVLLNLMTATNEQEAKEVLKSVRMIDNYLRRGIEKDAETRLSQKLIKMREEMNERYEKYGKRTPRNHK